MAGVLNGVGRFAAAAATPILLNLCLIAALLLLVGEVPTAGHALAIGVFVAGVVQFAWLLFALRRAGLPLYLPRPRLTPAVKRVLMIMGPAALGAGWCRSIWSSTSSSPPLPAGRRDLLPVLCRPDQPVAHRRRRRGGGDGPAAAAVAPGRRRRGRCGTTEPQPCAGAWAAAVAARHGRLSGHSGGTGGRPVRAWGLHRRRLGRDRHDTGGLCGGPACLCHGQGTRSRLLCPVRHIDATEGRHCCGHGEPRPQSRPRGAAAAGGWRWRPRSRRG